MTVRIDAHHHLWRYNSEEFGWLEGDLAPLRRDFLTSDLHAEMKEARVVGAVTVQARQSIEETEWLLELAGSTPEIWGVVGWLPIAELDFARHLEKFSSCTLLKGLRHVVQAEAAGFLDSAAFNAGIRSIAGTNLVYDLLVHHHQLEESIRFVDRHPNQLFVLDHIAKPLIAAGQIAPWSEQIRSLAKRHNVFCKISGMVTEAKIPEWTSAELEPYFQTVLEAFSPARLMIGTDWPVLTVACTYAQWWQTVESWIAPLASSERADILGGVTQRCYRLEDRSVALSSPDRE